VVRPTLPRRTTPRSVLTASPPRDLRAALLAFNSASARWGSRASS
jgi:hypothetical protein